METLKQLASFPTGSNASSRQGSLVPKLGVCNEKFIRAMRALNSTSFPHTWLTGIFSLRHMAPQVSIFTLQHMAPQAIIFMMSIFILPHTHCPVGGHFHLSIYMDPQGRGEFPGNKCTLFKYKVLLLKKKLGAN